MPAADIIEATRTWVQTFVIAEGLCPFAGKPMAGNEVRFSISTAATEQALLEDLTVELEHLGQHPEIETTLLVHPEVLTDFPSYNQFLDGVDGLLRASALEGIFQVASFHPDYQFAGTEPGDPENYTNRSPYPMLHLLREASIEAAVNAFDDVDKVPERNIRHLNSIGTNRLHKRWLACFTDGLSED